MKMLDWASVGEATERELELERELEIKTRELEEASAQLREWREVAGTDLWNLQKREHGWPRVEDPYPLLEVFYDEGSDEFVTSRVIRYLKHGCEGDGYDLVRFTAISAASGIPTYLLHKYLDGEIAWNWGEVRRIAKLIGGDMSLLASAHFGRG